MFLNNFQIDERGCFGDCKGAMHCKGFNLIKMIKKLSKILTLSAALSSNIVFAERVQFTQFFNTLESLKSNFTQTVYSAGDIFISENSGKFTFQRPQQLRWHTTTPNEQILILNNNELWLVDTELEQAVLQKTKDFSETPLYWLINKPDALKDTPKYAYSEGGIDWYSVNESTQPVKFGFVGNKLTTISLENELDQVIYIVFNDMQVNTKINPKAFELDISPEFDIIR
ncbi:Outer membrane lipoprotein carrier protein LolA [hydrothermal vent metagenome]|uniref:Outer membrane lipoprotein carrier protein LolA n=1 Tax=hydrothermal vent metagenome TaxID=652676 RepID=A0A1W1E4M2_9ZZZZ